MNKTGIDISKERLDDLDKEAIIFSLKNTIKDPTKRLADFGCGSGKISVCISSFGYTGYLFDLKPYTKRFTEISKELGINLNYKKARIESVTYSKFPKKLDLVISQKTLHYLNYSDALSFLKKVKKNLNLGGRIFVSFSGASSELSEGYDLTSKIENRFSKLSRENQLKHEIRKPVCLYSKKEVEKMMKNLGFRKIKVWESDFGNVKAVYEKR